MTVSKALTGHPDISEATRERVQAAARDMRYTVNVLARSLVQRRTRTIGAVVPDISEPFYAEMIRAIEGCLRGHGYDLLLADSANDPETETHAVRTLVEKRVDGCILGPTERAEGSVDLLRDAGVPFVLVNAPASFRDCDTIGIDRAEGARQAVEHLIASGYEDIYYLHTFPHLEQSREALRGCHEAMEARGKPRSDLRLVACADHRMETFHAAAKQHVHDRGRRIGLFVFDDEMAFGVLRAASEKGWDVPSSVGVVGFDDVRISRFLPKALTTVAHPKAEMGRQAANRLVEVLAAKARPAPRRTLLPVELVVRETTAPVQGSPAP
jgi:LacI family transcriptional regulator